MACLGRIAIEVASLTHFQPKGCLPFEFHLTYETERIKNVLPTRPFVEAVGQRSEILHPG